MFASKAFKAALRSFYPVLLLLVAGTGIVGYLKLEEFKAKWDLETALRENKELQNAIANLTATKTVAYVDVLQRDGNGSDAHMTLLFSETERGNPSKEICSGELEVIGEFIYFDALVISFDDKNVKEGKKAMYLWKGIFGDGQAPKDGFSFKGELPEAYKEISKALKSTFLGFTIRDDAKNFWENIWELAHDSKKYEAMGIHSIQGKAVNLPLKKGKRYKLTIGSTGKMDIKLEGDSPIFSPKPAGKTTPATN